VRERDGEMRGEEDKTRSVYTRRAVPTAGLVVVAASKKKGHQETRCQAYMQLAQPHQQPQNYTANIISFLKLG
jgi:hypothetical protein